MAVHIDPLTLAIGATAVAGIALAIYGFGQISDAIDDAFGPWGDVPHVNEELAAPPTNGQAGSGHERGSAAVHCEDRTLHTERF